MKILDDKKNIFFIAISLVCIGFVLGYSVHSSTSQKEVQKDENSKTKDTSIKKSDYDSITSKDKIRAELAKIDGSEVNMDEGLNEGGNTNTKIEKMAEGIDELVRLANADGKYDFKAVGQVKQALLDLAKQDSLALEELLVSYSDNLNNESVQDLLFQVVSQVKDPRVEALAKELALSSDRDERIAGFDLLGALQMPSEENLNLSVQALEQEQNDKELVLSALHAMSPMSLPSEKNEEVIDLLSDLTNNEDEAIRSESLISIASWAKTEADLASVVEALDSESVDDKISAAMALEESNVVGDNLKNTLLRKMQDPKELWEVRAMSANALARFELNTSEFSRLQNFRTEQVGGASN